MAITLVAHTIAGSSTTNNVTTPAIDTTGATLLIVPVVTFAPGGSIPPTDAKSNSWIPLTFRGTTGDLALQLFYRGISAIVGSGHTATVTTTGKFPSTGILAFAGTDTSSPFDAESGGHNTGSATIQPGSITPAATGEVFIAAYGGYSQAISLIDSGFTLLDTLTYDGNHLTTGFAYKIKTDALSENPTYTMTGSANNGVAMAAFKVGTGGGPPPSVMQSYYYRGMAF